MDRFSMTNPVLDAASKATQEVVCTYQQLQRAYRAVFGDTILSEIGSCSTCIREAMMIKAPSLRKKKLEAADHHLQIVKFWVNQSASMFYQDKAGHMRTVVTGKRMASCSSSLERLGSLLGGWLGSLQAEGVLCNQERA